MMELTLAPLQFDGQPLYKVEKNQEIHLNKNLQKFIE
jgi:hypothetical protein